MIYPEFTKWMRVVRERTMTKNQYKIASHAIRQFLWYMEQCKTAIDQPPWTRWTRTCVRRIKNNALDEQFISQA